MSQTYARAPGREQSAHLAVTLPKPLPMADEAPTLLDTELPPVEVQMEESWKRALAPEFRKPYFHELIDNLKAEIREGRTVYPAGPNIFKAFELTPLDQVKVLILGQDPYHNPGEAMGLSFSVPRGVRVPPSLANIFREMRDDVGFTDVGHGDLTHWAEQGTLLLNAMLTVRHRTPKSHHKLGWQDFTDAVIATVSREREHVAFMLWGAYAKKKAELVDRSKHLVLEAAHPSPLARDAYFGSKHFSQANAYLREHGLEPVDWQLPS